MKLARIGVYAQVKGVLSLLHKAYLVEILRNIVCKCIKFSLS
jgi:hypothetical protein